MSAYVSHEPVYVLAKTTHSFDISFTMEMNEIVYFVSEKVLYLL